MVIALVASDFHIHEGGMHHTQAWVLHQTPGRWRVLCNILAVSRTALFWNSDLRRWNLLGVTAVKAHITSWTTLAFMSHITLSPWYIIIFSCSFFPICLWPVVATSISTALFNSLSTTTMSPVPSCQSGSCTRSQLCCFQSLSVVPPIRTRVVLFYTWLNAPTLSYSIPATWYASRCMLSQLVSNTLLLCAWLSNRYLFTVSTSGLLCCDRSLPLWMWPVLVSTWSEPLCSPSDQPFPTAGMIS